MGKIHLFYLPLLIKYLDILYYYFKFKPITSLKYRNHNVILIKYINIQRLIQDSKWN